MIQFLVLQIKMGYITIEDVPKYREEILAAMKEEIVG